jgi:stage V sporulation protein SpoVS
VLDGVDAGGDGHVQALLAAAVREHLAAAAVRRFHDQPRRSGVELRLVGHRAGVEVDDAGEDELDLVVGRASAVTESRMLSASSTSLAMKAP